MTPIRVLLVDDHPLIREGLAAIVERSPLCQVVAEASNGLEALHLFMEFLPDVVVMDVKMPVMDGLQATARILEFDPNARIVIFSAYDREEGVFRAMKAGAMSYLTKDAAPEELVDAIQAAFEGKKRVNDEIATKLVERLNKPSLTEREVSILKLVAVGKSNREIGHEIAITEGTVKVHINHIFSKLNVTARTQAANIAMARGII